MKKVILSALMLGLVFTSCTDNGKEVEASDAVAIENNETAESVKLSTISDDSHVEWFASHLGGTAPRFGKIMLQSADVTVNNNVVENASVVIDINSLTVLNFEDDEEQAGKLSGHLKSADFFNAEVNPTAQFELASISAGSGDFNSEITGNLTILDSTKSISFNANVNVSDAGVSIMSEKFAIDRTEWGMSYHVEGSEGVPADYLIANEIGFIINVNLTK
ncbi:MAG: YceI family protein [Crocinitomicaceae bacterium]